MRPLSQGVCGCVEISLLSLCVRLAAAWTDNMSTDPDTRRAGRVLSGNFSVSPKYTNRAAARLFYKSCNRP